MIAAQVTVYADAWLAAFRDLVSRGMSEVAASAVANVRARGTAILHLPEAAGRQHVAYLLFEESDLSVEEVRSLLERMPRNEDPLDWSWGTMH